MLKVKDKPLLEWWVKDVCDVGYKDYRGNWQYSNEDIGWAVFLTISAVLGVVLGLVLFTGLVLVTKGILLVVTVALGTVVWALWKSIKAMLDREGN